MLGISKIKMHTQIDVKKSQLQIDKLQKKKILTFYIAFLSYQQQIVNLIYQ